MGNLNRQMETIETKQLKIQEMNNAKLNMKISIAIYSHPPTLLQLHLLLNPCSMDLLFQVLYFSALKFHLLYL